MYSVGVKMFLKRIFIFLVIMLFAGTNFCFAQGLDFLGGAPPPPAIKNKVEAPKPLLGGITKKKDDAFGKVPASLPDKIEEDEEEDDDDNEVVNNSPKPSPFATPATNKTPFLNTPKPAAVNNPPIAGNQGFPGQKMPMQQPVTQPPANMNRNTANTPPPSSQRRGFNTGLRAMTPSERVFGKRSTNIFKSMADLERKNAMLAMELEKERLQSEIDKAVEARKILAQQEKERQEAVAAALKLKEDTAMKKLLMEEEALLHKILMEEEQLKQAILAQRELRKESAFQRKKELEDIKLEQLKLEKEIKEEEWTRIQDQKAKDEKEKLKKVAAEAKKTIATLSDKLKAAKIADMDTIRGLQLKSVGVPSSIDAKMFGGSSGASDLPSFGSPPPLGASSLLAAGASSSTSALPSVGGSSFDWSSVGSSSGSSSVLPETPASQVFVVTEVKGLAGKLVAKLLSTNGMNFFARRGTVLTTGHTVLAVEKTHVLVAKNGKKEVLGFGSGASVVPLAGSDAAGSGGSGGGGRSSSRGGSSRGGEGGGRPVPSVARPSSPAPTGITNRSRGAPEER